MTTQMQPLAPGTKADTGKPRMDLLPVSLMTEVAKVLEYGARKYADRNWEAGIDYNRVYAAAMRHLLAWWGGEDLDQESGLPHLACATCELAFLMEFATTHPERDNRPRKTNGFANLRQQEKDQWKVNPVAKPEEKPGAVIIVDKPGEPGLVSKAKGFFGA